MSAKITGLSAEKHCDNDTPRFLHTFVAEKGSHDCHSSPISDRKVATTFVRQTVDTGLDRIMAMGQKDIPDSIRITSHATFIVV